MLVFIIILAAMVPVLSAPPASGDQSVPSFQERFGLPAQPERVLEEVLSREEFQKSPLQEFWQRILERAGEMIRAALRWIFDRASGLGSSEANLDTLWTIGASLITGSVAVLFIYAIMKVVGSLLGRSPSAPRTSAADARSESETESRDQLLESARSASEAGNYGEAVILLFRAALLRLDEGGRVALHPGKTNREILSSMRGDDSVKPVLGQMVPLFNRVRYGNRECTRGEYDGFLDLYVRVTERN